jgi:hypothetical protein
LEYEISNLKELQDQSVLSSPGWQPFFMFYHYICTQYQEALPLTPDELRAAVSQTQTAMKALKVPLTQYQSSQNRVVHFYNDGVPKPIAIAFANYKIAKATLLFIQQKASGPPDDLA